MHAPPELLAAIAADPDADAPRLALAEWWEANGERDRAEYLRLILALEAAPPGVLASQPEMKRRYEELTNLQKTLWSDELPQASGLYWLWERGLPQHLSVSEWDTFEEHAERIFAQAPLSRVTFWRLRSPRRLFDSPLLERIPSLNLSRILPRSLNAAAVAALAASPYARNLHTLLLPALVDASGTLDALARSPHLTGLRRLDVNQEANATTGPTVELNRLPALPPALTHLSLSQVHLSEDAWRDLLACPVAPRLQSLHLWRCQIGPEHLAMLGDGARLAALENWHLSNNPLGAEGVAHLASAHRLDALRHLWLGNTRLDDDGLLHLARAAVMDRLVDLGVSANFLTDRGLLGWLAHRTYPMLHSLDLGDNRIGDAGLWALGQSTHVPVLRQLRCAPQLAREAIVTLVGQRFREGLPPLTGPMPAVEAPVHAPVVSGNPHADEDGLLEAIIAAPHDPVPRLVYADWLEEQGEAERAALLRTTPGSFHTQPLEIPRAWEKALSNAQLHQGLLYLTGQMRWLMHRSFGEEGTEWLRRQRVFRLHLRGKTDWAKVAQMPWLRHIRILAIDDHVLGADGLAQLLTSPHLERLLGLELPNNGLWNQQTLGVLTAATTIPHLCSLSLARNHLQEPALARLVRWSGAARLRHLDLTGASLISVALLSTNPHFEGLTRLILDETRLGEHGTRQLLHKCTFDSLTHLHLRECDLTDEALRTLVDSSIMPRLRWLDLRHNPLTDAALTLLSGSPRVHEQCHLRLSKRGLSASAIQQAAERFGTRMICD